MLADLMGVFALALQSAIKVFRPGDSQTPLEDSSWSGMDQGGSSNGITDDLDPR